MLVKYPNPLLNERSVAAFGNLTNDEISKIISLMRSECWKVGGFAISAIQVGDPYTILGYFSFKKKEYQWIIDPEIIDTSGSSSLNEGCLSIPGYFWNIIRPSKVTISYKDINGIDRVRTFTGVIARAILHEMDHFDGILIPDFMSDDEAKTFNSHYTQNSHIEEYVAPSLNAI